MDPLVKLGHGQDTHLVMEKAQVCLLFIHLIGCFGWLVLTMHGENELHFMELWSIK